MAKYLSVDLDGLRARPILEGSWVELDMAFRAMPDDSGFDTLRHLEGLIVAYLLGSRKEKWTSARKAG